MLSSPELMLLITLNDTVSTPESKIPDHLQPIAKQLLERNLLKLTKGILYPSKKAKLLIRTAKNENKFRRILPMMNFRMIANLWHRLIEYCMSSGFHLNVVLKNVNEEGLLYISKELEEAKKKRKVVLDITNINIEK
jgi:hypothetical protein